MPASKRKAASSSSVTATGAKQAVAVAEGFNGGSSNGKKARKNAAAYFDDDEDEEEEEEDDSKTTHGMMSAAMMDDMIDDEDDEDDESSGDEEEEEEDFEGLEAAGPSTTSSSRHEAKPSSKNLYKPVTVEEMNTLRREGEERGGSFEFGMKVRVLALGSDWLIAKFHLQLTALLSSTFIDPLPAPGGKAYSPSSPAPLLTAFLTNLHSHLLSMASLPALPVQPAIQRLAPLAIPFPSPAPTGSEKWQLAFETPKEVFVAGGWNVMGTYRKGRRVAGNATKGKGKEIEVSAIDLAVVMPESLFTPKDRLSNRYFHKRAHYVAAIASSLETLTTQAKKPKKQAAAEDDVQRLWREVKLRWAFLGGDVRRPILELLLPKDKARGFKHAMTIRIMPSLAPAGETFALSQLYPSKSNFRIAGESRSNADDAGTISGESSSPRYNQSIVLDSLHRYYLLWLHHLHKTCPAFRPALALWRIWGDRRGLSSRSGAGAIGWSWFGAAVLAFIVEGGDIVAGKDNTQRGATEPKPKKGLGRGLSEWQLLRAAWEFLASTDFAQTAVSVKPLAGQPSIPVAEFTNVFDHVLVDASAQVNLFATWERGEVDLLRHEARNTLSMLADTTDRFDETFLQPLQSPFVRFDDVLKFTAPAASYKPERALDKIEQPDELRLLADKVAEVVRRGLGARARLVCVGSPAILPFDLQDSARSLSHTSQTLAIGVIFDREEHARILDMGPSAEQEEACRSWKAFWGSKSELRRFKDGKISESVVWNVHRPEERIRIPGLIVQWLLARHFGVQEVDIEWPLAGCQKVTQQPSSAHQLVNTVGSEKLAFRPVFEAFDELYKALKAKDDDLPLTILNFTPMSPALRYTSTFIPHPVDIGRVPSSPECIGYVAPIEVLIQFESSGRWPDDLVAIQKIKLAFMAKLSEVIETTVRGASAQVVLEAAAPDVQDHAIMEVIMPAGVAFHLRIYHDRERTLLERMVEDPDLPSTRLRSIAQATYDLHVRRFTSAPRHHAAISTLHHRYPSYAAATRLMKRWLAAHLLAGHFAEETIELLVADVYVNPGPLGIPCSPQSGLLRALERLSTWNWREQPVVVPLYSVTSGDETIDANALRAASSESAESLRKEALATFEDARKKDPECLTQTTVVATEEDVGGRAWTAVGQPTRLASGRLVALAKAAVEVVQQQTEGQEMDIKVRFCSRDAYGADQD